MFTPFMHCFTHSNNRGVNEESTDTWVLKVLPMSQLDCASSGKVGYAGPRQDQRVSLENQWLLVSRNKWGKISDMIVEEQWFIGGDLQWNLLLSINANWCTGIMTLLTTWKCALKGTQFISRTTAVCTSTINWSCGDLNLKIFFQVKHYIVL